MKRVTWTIELDEDTAEAAAVVALAIMRDQESTATVFDVTDEKGKTVSVDLRRAVKLTPLLRCDGCGRRFSGTEELERVFPDIPDLLVGYRGRWLLLEVKMPGGALEAGQELFHGACQALGLPCEVVRTVEDCQRVLKRERRVH